MEGLLCMIDQKGVERSSHVMFQGITPAFGWRNWGELWETFVEIIDLCAKKGPHKYTLEVLTTMLQHLAN